MGPHEVTKTPLASPDSIVRTDMAFAKINVKGPKLKVLEGARRMLRRSHPIFWAR